MWLCQNIIIMVWCWILFRIRICPTPFVLDLVKIIEVICHRGLYSNLIKFCKEGWIKATLLYDLLPTLTPSVTLARLEHIQQSDISKKNNLSFRIFSTKFLFLFLIRTYACFSNFEMSVPKCQKASSIKNYRKIIFTYF